MRIHTAQPEPMAGSRAGSTAFGPMGRQGEGSCFLSKGVTVISGVFARGGGAAGCLEPTFIIQDIIKNLCWNPLGFSLDLRAGYTPNSHLALNI